MSLVPRIKAKEESNSWDVTDITGLYSYENLGGYGVQNLRPQWLDTVTLVVEHIRTGKKSLPLDVSGNMGKDGGKFQVMPWDIDSSWKVLPVGKYKFTYSITGTVPGSGNKKSAETSVVSVAIKQAECCLDKLVGKTLNIDFSSLFKDELSRKVALLSTLMRRTKDALKPECSNLDAADRMVYYIDINCDCNC
jgi:hypothetical protein